MITAHVKGLKELDAFLSALPKKLETGAYRAGLTAAAAVVRDEAKLRAPKRTGKMARAIRSSSPRKNQDGTFSIKVYVDGRREHGFLGIFHEYGVSPHFIKAGDAGMSAKLLSRASRRGDVTGEVATKKLKIGDNYISGSVIHPGHAAQPFMRPALDAKWQQAVEAFRVRIIRYIEGKTGFNAGAVLDEAA